MGELPQLTQGDSIKMSPLLLFHLQKDSGAGLTGVHKKEKGVEEGMTNDLLLQTFLDIKSP